jgi:hypothetical protein
MQQVINLNLVFILSIFKKKIRRNNTQIMNNNKLKIHHYKNNLMKIFPKTLIIKLINILKIK